MCVCVSPVYADFLHLRHQHLQESHYSLQRKFTLPGEDLTESMNRLIKSLDVSVLERNISENVHTYCSAHDVLTSVGL